MEMIRKRSAGASQGNRRNVQAKADGKILPRARLWCERWLGMALIAAGWAFAIAAVLMPSYASWIVYRFELSILAAALFGAGVGWQMRGSR